MLKVKRKEGKFDIILDEESLFKADRKHRLKGGKNSTQHSIRPSEGKQDQTSTTHAVTKKQTKAKDGKLIYPSKTKRYGADVSDTKKRVQRPDSKSCEVNNGGEGSRHPTKEQMSRRNTQQHFQESEEIKDGNHRPQPLTRISKDEIESVDANSVSQFEAGHNAAASSSSSKQTNLVEKNSQWKKELDQQVTAKQRLKAKEDDKSKEEIFEEYNPWGRPGGGAPIRTQSGNIVADYRRMILDLSSKSDGSVSSIGRTAPHAATITETQSTVQPVAMRSSFAIGSPGVVSYETQQKKAEDQRNWLRDLEQQIKEKKEREIDQKYEQSQQQESRQGMLTTPADHSQHAVSTVTNSSFREGSSHARGYGLNSFHQMYEDEQERRRLKTLQHQLAVQEQVEERRRMKQEEKEKRLKEEAEEERKLAEEQATFQNRFQKELQTRQHTEEEARRRIEALHSSVLEAYESAQQAKREKRIRQLEYGGHDVSGLISRTEAASQLHDKRQAAQAVTLVRSSTRHEETETQNNQSHEGNKERTEVPTPSDGKFSALSFTKSSSFKLELEENGLNTSLVSEWRPKSPTVATGRNKERLISQTVVSSPTREGVKSISRASRSHSEKGERKKPKLKQQIKKGVSVENMTMQGRSDTSPVHPPMDDAFLVPYRRTSSATFPAVPSTPSPQQPTDVHRAASNTRESQVMGLALGTSSTHFHNKTSEATSTKHTKDTVRRTVVLRKNQMRETNRQPVLNQDSKNKTGVKKATSKQKTDVAETGITRAAQISPDSLPTSRQEMILQQLAALRQGLMLKERELQHGAL